MNGIYRSNAIPIRELILKFISKDKEIKIIKTSLKKNKFEGPTLPCFNTYYNKAIITKTVLCW